jgi:hypothetical protein
MLWDLERGCAPPSFSFRKAPMFGPSILLILFYYSKTNFQL